MLPQYRLEESLDRNSLILKASVLALGFNKGTGELFGVDISRSLETGDVLVEVVDEGHNLRGAKRHAGCARVRGHTHQHRNRFGKLLLVKGCFLGCSGLLHEIAPFSAIRVMRREYILSLFLRLQT